MEETRKDNSFIIDELRSSIIKLNRIVEQKQNRIKYLEQYLLAPQYDKGAIVYVIGKDDKQYIVDCVVCYDISYPVYNLISVDNKEDIETIVEIDIYN